MSKFSENHKSLLIAIVIVLLCVAGILGAVGIYKGVTSRNEKKAAVYEELVRYNGMPVCGKFCSVEGGSMKYTIMVKDPEQGFAYVDIDENAYKRYEINDTINEIVPKAENAAVMTSGLDGETSPHNGIEVVTIGNHDYLTTYSVVPVYYNSIDVLATPIKVVTGICHYEDCQYCSVQ